MPLPSDIEAFRTVWEPGFAILAGSAMHARPRTDAEEDEGVARLNDDERKSAVASLDGWEWVSDREGIASRFLFEDFGEAFAFMTRVALEAEKADHHPEWSNVWNRVDVFLTTHDAGGMTAKDIALARRITEIALGLRPAAN